MSDGLVVVGGSYAGLQVAASAREFGYSEPIRLIAGEPVLPYQRPPLSKGYLTGKTTPAMLPLRGEAFYRDASIDVELGRHALRIDPHSRSVELSDGRKVRYDRLVLATGARPRPLPVPGGDLDGVVALRSLADADRLRALAAEARNVVVVGGGFIGLEVASALVSADRSVTVVEAANRLMARAVPPVLSEFFAELHRARGVRLKLGCGVTALSGVQGRVTEVLCGDGTSEPADLVVVGIGVVPNVELAHDLGLPCNDGILVDGFARTAAPGVFAAGDCARQPHPHAASPTVRLESVQNAIEQGKAAASVLAGSPAANGAVPWFWSDQYDVKLQMAGLPQGSDRVAVRGTVEEGKFSVFHFRAGCLVGVDSVNRPAEHMLARKLLAAGVALTPEQAADTAFDLRGTLAASAEAAP